MSISAHFSVTTVVMLVVGGLAAIVFAAAVATKSAEPRKVRVSPAPSSIAPSSSVPPPTLPEGEIEYQLDTSEPMEAPSR